MEFEEYKIMYEAEDTHWWYRGMRGVMFSLLKLNSRSRADTRILDAGCGTGGNLAALRTAGFSPAGFDLNEPALYFCQARGLTNVQHGSITAIPHAANSFDIVVSCDVLNDAGTQNEQAALAEMFRVLRPGGLLFLNLPAFSFLRGEHDRATDVARRYRRRQIRQMLSDAGFNVRRVTYWNMFLFPVVVAVRFLRKDKPEQADEAARSDIVQAPAPVNALLTLVTGIEALLIRKLDLPLGSSVAVVAQKPRM